jgi:cytochrome b pre-mRNA-processing protein 3
LFGIRLFKPRPSDIAGQALFDSVVVQARSPVFYRDMGAPDSPIGRFELYTLHVVLLTRRLRGRGPQAQETAQALFDAYLLNLDIALREMGVGDLSMGKKMKKLGQAFYGRVKSWDAALGDRAAEEALIARTVYEGLEAPDVGPLAGYVSAVAAGLETQEDAALLAGQVRWPEAGR